MDAYISDPLSEPVLCPLTPITQHYTMSSQAPFSPTCKTPLIILLLTSSISGHKPLIPAAFIKLFSNSFWAHPSCSTPVVGCFLKILTFPMLSSHFLILDKEEYRGLLNFKYYFLTIKLPHPSFLSYWISHQVTPSSKIFISFLYLWSMMNLRWNIPKRFLEVSWING